MCNWRRRTKSQPNTNMMPTGAFRNKPSAVEKWPDMQMKHGRGA